VDSHLALPTVSASADELETDIAPFAALSSAPMAMTAHVVYEAWDKDRCATLSPKVIKDIIRGRIGFDGLLMSDDIDMKALSGTAGEKSKAAIDAGCDIALDCWGRMDEMIDIANQLPEISAASRARLDRAIDGLSVKPDPQKAIMLMAKRDTLLAIAA
jgi:beta-N-acetylhexosaminidase